MALRKSALAGNGPPMLACFAAPGKPVNSAGHHHRNHETRGWELHAKALLAYSPEFFSNALLVDDDSAGQRFGSELNFGANSVLACARIPASKNDGTGIGACVIRRPCRQPGPAVAAVRAQAPEPPTVLCGRGAPRARGAEPVWTTAWPVSCGYAVTQQGVASSPLVPTAPAVCGFVPGGASQP